MGLFDVFKRSPAVPIVGPDWDSYFYDFGDGDHETCTVSFDVDLAREQEHRGFPHGRRVILFIPVESVGPNGLPLEPVRRQLFDYEDAALRAVTEAKVACRFVGAQSYSGMRELVFQVDDVPAFERAIAVFEKSCPWKVEVRASEGWAFFDEKIRPDDDDWSFIADRGVFENLEKAGADFSKPHELEHVFYGSREPLLQLQAQLEAVGFRCVRLTDVEDGRKRLVISKAMPLNLREVNRTTERLRFLARLLKVDYDGWGCVAVK